MLWQPLSLQGTGSHASGRTGHNHCPTAGEIRAKLLGRVLTVTAVAAVCLTAAPVVGQPANPLRGPGQTQPQPAQPQPAQPQPAQPLPAAEVAQAAATGEGQPLAGTEIYAQTKAARTAEDYSRIIALCAQSLATDPEEAERTYLKRLKSWAHNRRGESYVRAATEATGAAESGELDELAIKDFNWAISLDPERWKAIHNRGVSLAVQGKLAEALADFDRTLELRPDYPNAWYNRGEVQFEQGDFEAALQSYQKSLELMPDDLGAVTAIAHCHFERKEYEAALGGYSKVLERGKDAPLAHLNRADAYAALGRHEEAALDYREALKRNPQSDRAHRSVAWFMATCPDQRFRNPELAVTMAEKALQLASAPTAYHYDALAAAHAAGGRFSDAQQAIDQALNLAPVAQRTNLQQRQKLYQQQTAYEEAKLTQRALY